MSEENVIYIDRATELPVPYDRVLRAAIDNLDPEEPMLVLGYEPDGAFYFAGNQSDLGQVLILLKRAETAAARMLEDPDD